MTLQEEKFINAFFRLNGNKSRAAEEAGYSDPNAVGSRVAAQPEVAAEIARRLDEMAMPANEVLARLADHARADVSEFLTISGRGVRLDVAKGIKAGKGHLLKKYGKSPRAVVEIEMVDAQGALVQLGRFHKLFTDKIQHSGAIRTEGVDLSKLTDAELEAMEALMTKAAESPQGEIHADSEAQ